MASQGQRGFDKSTTGSHACDQDPPWTLSSETASLHSARKRSSFFGRSNSDASSMRRAPATSHSAKLSFGAVRMDEDVVRPTTAVSSESRRRKTDPLHSLRDSIFGGGRKKFVSGDRAEVSNSRPSSRGSEAVLQSAPVHASSFDSEDDYYRHRRKHSISPPFNFQHVTHTARNQLPRLETVDEKDLPGQFWSVAASQRPRRRVHGIKVDDLGTKHRQMGLIVESPEPSVANSPPTLPPQPLVPLPPSLEIPQKPGNNDLRLISPISPVSPFGSHLSESASESTPSENVDQSETHVVRHPKRYSSLGLLNQHTQRPYQQSAEADQASNFCSHDSFYDSNSSSESEMRRASLEGDLEARKMSVPKLNASMPPDLSWYDVAFRSRQPLPSIPPQSSASRRSPDQAQITSVGPSTMLSPTLPPTVPTSPKSKRSSRSSYSARRSAAASKSSIDLRNPSVFSVSDASWEDDVDLAYEQEAESTCDFTWNGSNQARTSGVQQELSKRDSTVTISHAGSPNLSTPSDSGMSIRRTSSTDTISKSTDAPHRRGLSVGHRGFLAARKNSSTPDLLSKAKEPPTPLQFSQPPAQVSVLSPVFSIPDEEERKSPFTAAELHYPHVQRVSTDYLSDPESYRNSNSSKHRKSSSYGSHGSYDGAGARGNPRASYLSTARWSIASSGSMPELMHSRPKSKSSLSRSVKSQPLETLPQSPPDSGKETAFRESPRSSSTEPARRASVPRGSADSHERVVLQAAGRPVQRGRPGSYVRYSQHLEPPPPPPQGGVRESMHGGPAWI